MKIHLAISPGSFVARILVLTVFVLGIWAIAGGNSRGENTASRIYNMDDCPAEDSVRGRALTARVDSLADKRVLSLSAWQNECLFQVETAPGDNFYLKPDGNLEWEIILSTKPDELELCFPLHTRGLSFYFQPELTALEIADGASRPDSVIGSYAVYHAFGRNNRRVPEARRIRTITYGSGKAFHIYAPYAWDINGLTVKAELKIDTLQNRLCVTLPRDFIDRAVYPVIIDPQFGKTDIGASAMNMSAGNSGGGLFTAPQNGNIDSISVFIDEDGTAGTVGGAVYLDDNGCADLIDTTLAIYNTIANQDRWFQMPAAESAGLSEGGDHWIMAFTGGSALSLRYDTRSGAAAIRDFNDLWPPDNPCSAPSWNYPDRELSLYVTYTVTSTGETGRRRRFILIQ